jgi:putative tricarboxylic transport membrane protein
MRKLFTAATLAATLVAGTASAFTPQRPECVAPAKPGGGYDLTCRVAVGAMEAAGVLQQPMAVTFMPGGIGAVAFNQFNTSRSADGDTLVAISSGGALNIATGKWGKQWGPDDARYVASVGADYGAIIVRADSPYRTLDDLARAVREEPSSLVLGAGGSVGSQDWMKAVLLFKAMDADVKGMRYVAFDGGGEAVANLLGGTIDVYPGDVTDMLGHLESGKLRVLAVLAEDRLPEPFDQFPTAKELGYDVEWTIFRGYYVGKNVSEEAYDFWVNAFEKAYETDAFKELRDSKGLLPMNMAGEEFDEYVKKRIRAYRDLAQEIGLVQ